MDSTTRFYFENLHAKDKDLQYEAFNQIMVATQVEVDWAYDVWDQLLEDLRDSNNHTRSRAAQFLCTLAKSDPEKRMMKDFPSVWEVTFDKKFVTARHTLQSIWKIGLAGEEQKKMVINQLVDRYINCLPEKNYTLIRFDILQGLRNLYDAIKDEAIKEITLDLITKEEDPKYKKKYAAVWKNV
ncbi:hypothetical protein V7087_26260 [Neobacillus niacini]|uniref:hypothetical protein n=1 Tax=Neobacillus niacini TaxID=86668 RepID=UPI002FFFBF23